MKKQIVYFEAPYRVRVTEEPVGKPAVQELLIRTIASAIGAGTELLIYRGEAPLGMAVDETIMSLPGTFEYPLRYGYVTVGEVVETGPGPQAEWLDRRIFAFHPHLSHFVAAVEEVEVGPNELSAEDALFFPTMETAQSISGIPRSTGNCARKRRSRSLRTGIRTSTRRTDLEDTPIFSGFWRVLFKKNRLGRSYCEESRSKKHCSP